jgi:hypothetical protein
MTVKSAIGLLTPPSENNTSRYMQYLTSQGVNVDKKVADQIDTLMKAVRAAEGMISGTEIDRTP